MSINHPDDNRVHMYVDQVPADTIRLNDTILDHDDRPVHVDCITYSPDGWLRIEGVYLDANPSHDVYDYAFQEGVAWIERVLCGDDGDPLLLTESEMLALEGSSITADEVESDLGLLLGEEQHDPEYVYYGQQYVTDLQAQVESARADNEVLRHLNSMNEELIQSLYLQIENMINLQAQRDGQSHGHEVAS